MLNNFGEEDVSEDIVKILAYLIAEGHLSNNFILFSNEDQKIVNDFKSSVTNYDSNLEINNHGKYNYRVVNTSLKRDVSGAKRDLCGKFVDGSKFNKKNTLRKFLEDIELYGKLSYDKFIPDLIYKLPKKKLSIFLNRLFSCDGSIYEDKGSSTWRLSYSSSSKKMIYQVQSLLLKFSVKSKVRKKKINNFISYEIVIRGSDVYSYLQEIGFYGEKEDRQAIALRSIPIKNPNLDTIPKEIWDSYRPENWAEAGRQIGYKNPKSLRTSINYAPSREKLLQIALVDQKESIQKLANSDIFWDEIVGIEEINEKVEVYDLSVPEYHNFVANGVIIHNSYSMGVIAEGFSLLEDDVKQNLSIVLLDTMGIYWTMKYANKQEEWLLKDWGLKAKPVDMTIFTPYKYYEEYKKQGIPTDKPFAIAPSMLTPDDWCLGFKQDKYEPNGILISRVIYDMLDQGEKFSINDIIKRVQKDENSEKSTRDAVESMFLAAENWGVFRKEGTPISEVCNGGQISVLDVSCYATMPGGWDVKALVVGVFSQHVFIDRMKHRKYEEYKEVEAKKNYFTVDDVKTQEMPLVWLVIDEAHEFLPVKGRVASTDALVTIMREGRQPGVCLILATQQPGKIHTDVMTQSDIVFSHRITAKLDTEALGLLAQSYMREGINMALNNLPRVKGAAVLFDDANERLFSMRVRPRFTWHGGSSPNAIKEKKDKLGI